MRKLLSCLAKGGKQFYEHKVKKGFFFKSITVDVNMIYLNSTTVDYFNTIRERNKLTSNSLFRRMIISMKSQDE